MLTCHGHARQHLLTWGWPCTLAFANVAWAYTLVNANVSKPCTLGNVSIYIYIYIFLIRGIMNKNNLQLVTWEIIERYEG